MAEGFSRRGMGGFTGGAQMYDMGADPTWAGDFGASTMATADPSAINALLGVDPAVVAESQSLASGFPKKGHFGAGWLQDFLENLDYALAWEKERASKKQMDYLVRTGQMPPIEVLEEQSTSPIVEALLPQIQTGDVSRGLSVKDARDLKELATWGWKEHSSLATQKAIDAFKNEGIIGQEDIPGVTSSEGTYAYPDLSSDWKIYEIDPNKDSTVSALKEKASKEGLQAIIDSSQSEWDKQWARNKLLGVVEESDSVIDLPGGKIVNGALVLDESKDAWEEFLEWPDIKPDKKEESLTQRNNRWASGGATDKERQTDRYKEWDALTGNWQDKKDSLVATGLEKIIDNIALGVASADDEGMENARLAFPSGLPPLDEITAQQIVQGDVPASESGVEAFEDRQWRESAARDLQAAIRREVVKEPSPLVATAPSIVKAHELGISPSENLDWLGTEGAYNKYDTAMNRAARNTVLEGGVPWRSDYAGPISALVSEDFHRDHYHTQEGQARSDKAKELLDQLTIGEQDALEFGETPAWLNQGYPDDLPEYDVPVLEDGRLAGMQEGVYGIPDPVIQPTSRMGGMQDRWDANIPSISASRARTQELNTLGRELLPHEIEAIKRGDLINPREQIVKEMDAFEQGKIAAKDEAEQTDKIFEGLSPALIDAIQADPALMDQYLASREEILARLATGPSPTPGGFTTRTPYVDQIKTQEDWYPGGQASAVGAGFWGPMALPWNPKYRDYKDAQRVFMGKEPGEKYYSDDWIRAFGWMTPEQINELVGY